MKKFIALFLSLVIFVATFSFSASAAVIKDETVSPLISQDNVYTIPGGQGTITSNAWRDTVHSVSGNTYQWDYQVSAVYSGSKSVEYIKTSWKATASLRNSAGINVGIGDTISAGASSSWQSVTTVEKHWTNMNGSKIADYSSNIVVAPKGDYKEFSIALTNTATVKLISDPKPYEITAGV